MKRRRPEFTCLALATAVALLSARPYADGFNDGSRLATVESLGERGTFCIDDSLFVRPSFHPGRSNPYNPRIEGVRVVGTLDKVRIDGRFYSDKPPVPALLSGGCYRLWLDCGGAPARDAIGGFCYWWTVLASGVPFAIAVFAMCRTARDLGFPPLWQLLFAASFAGCTLALVYTRHLNGHIQLLATAAVVCWQLVRLAVDPSQTRLILMGASAGLGFTLDLAIGPILFGLVLLAVVGTTRSIRSVGLFSASALPFSALHFALNYGLGSTFVPLGSVMEYLDYPDSAFGPHNATGNWKHGSITAFAGYAFALLFGERGFLAFHPTLWLALPAAVWLWLKADRFRRIVLAIAISWPLLSWALYSATSNNHSGSCCSIRWFVPLLAPGYLTLGLLLKEHPRFRTDFLWLSAVGGAVTSKSFEGGPWEHISADEFVPTLAVGLAGWLAIRIADRARRPMRNIQSTS